VEEDVVVVVGCSGRIYELVSIRQLRNYSRLTDQPCRSIGVVDVDHPALRHLNLPKVRHLAFGKNAYNCREARIAACLNAAYPQAGIDLCWTVDFDARGAVSRME
jgi:hypothetical protein